MPAKGSPAWYRERRDAPPISQAKIVEDGILRFERNELLGLLRKAHNEINRVLAFTPIHDHEIPGIWGRDGGSLVGQPCEWCKTWARIREVLVKYPA